MVEVLFMGKIRVGGHLAKPERRWKTIVLHFLFFSHFQIQTQSKQSTEEEERPC